MSTGLIFLFALAAGASVANLFYNQPLLARIGEKLSTSPGALGAIPTLSEIGYAFGMLLLIPLGDVADRRKVVWRMAAGCALALAGAAFAPTFGVLLASSLFIGLGSGVPQVLMPFASELSGPAQRGRVIGAIQSGLLIGVLVSRTLSGWVGEHFGWRTMYGIAAVVMIALALLLRAKLPTRPPRPTTLPYRKLLGSLWTLWKEERALRFHALWGGLTFGANSVFWAALALHLSELPGHYGPAVAGTFGFVGIAGATVAPFAGRWADRRRNRTLHFWAFGALLCGFAVMLAFGQTLWGIALGAAVLDLGQQTNQVGNQTRVLGLRPEASSRANTLYMTTFILGGAVGSALGPLMLMTEGWTGVCVLGLALAGAGWASLLWAGPRHADRSAEPAT